MRTVHPGGYVPDGDPEHAAIREVSQIQVICGPCLAYFASTDSLSNNISQLQG